MMKKSILVTGANSGIGRATAEYLASNGFDVYGCARMNADIAELDEMENITGLKLDVTRDEDVERAARFIKERGTGLFGLVNNAGIAEAGPLMDISVEDLKKQFDVNLFGLHGVTKALFPLLKESTGRIVMISSNSGFWAAPFFGPYNASKFAVEGYADTLRRELLIPEFQSMKVIIIQPGNIMTPIWNKGKKMLEKYKDSPFSKYAKKIGEYAIEKGTTRGLDPVKVAEKVHVALTDKKPKLRYLVAPDRFRNAMLRILPGKKVDGIIKKEFNKM
ncbi:MAG: SDR family oxidoreductase [Promethearchaeota archaeon]